MKRLLKKIKACLALALMAFLLSASVPPRAAARQAQEQRPLTFSTEP